MEIKKGDRIILSRLNCEDEEYYSDYLKEEGTVISNPEGRFPCVWVKFDNFQGREYLFIENLDII